MEINKILSTVAEMLDLPSDVVSDVSSDEKCLSLLILSFNNVVTEIAEEYVPFEKSESIFSIGGMIPFYSFSEKVYKVKSILNDKGKKVKFTMGQKGVFVDGDQRSYTVNYTYIPKSVGYGESVDLPSHISERTISYGVAGEYAMIAGRYDDCVNYDTRFNSAINSAKRDIREKVLPVRRCF